MIRNAACPPGDGKIPIRPHMWSEKHKPMRTGADEVMMSHKHGGRTAEGDFVLGAHNIGVTMNICLLVFAKCAFLSATKY